jgi:urease beta subunit
MFRKNPKELKYFLQNFLIAVAYHFYEKTVPERVKLSITGGTSLRFEQGEMKSKQE